MGLLLPGQFMIEGLIFGKGTPYVLTGDSGGFDIQPYGVAAGDYQVPRQDENRFGQDQLTPGPINIQLGLLQNRWLRTPPAGATLVQADLGRLQKIWRGDDVRYKWGEMQQLAYGSIDGTDKLIYGRCGKFQYSKINPKTESHTVTAEFRRADILSYSAVQYVREFVPNAAPLTVTNGTGGDAPSWVTIFLQGPLKTWTLNFGGISIPSNWDIPEGKILEINSYPWTRRAVDSDGINRRANLIGATPYLDRLKFKDTDAPTVSLTATGTNGNSKGVVAYRDAFQVIK